MTSSIEQLYRPIHHYETNLIVNYDKYVIISVLNFELEKLIHR